MTKLKDNYIVVHNLPHLPVAIIEDRSVLKSGNFILEDPDPIEDMVILSLEVFFDGRVERIWYCIDRKYTKDEQSIVNRVVYDKCLYIIETVRQWDRAHFNKA